MHNKLTNELAALLQLPKNTVRATLVLEARELPKLTIERHLFDLGEMQVSAFKLEPLTTPAQAEEQSQPFNLERLVCEAKARLAAHIDFSSARHINLMQSDAMLRAYLSRNHDRYLYSPRGSPVFDSILNRLANLTAFEESGHIAASVAPPQPATPPRKP